jgi:hypothetical protein
MNATECSKRTAQLAITEACQQGWPEHETLQSKIPAATEEANQGSDSRGEAADTEL